MSRVDRLLLAIVVVLGLSVLLTGGLSVYLTLAQMGDENGPTAEAMEAMATAVVTREPRIAFASDQEGEAAIYVLDADGANRRRISGDDQGPCLFPSWSLDGKRVAFLELSERAGAGVWAADLDGSPPLSVSHPISNASPQDIEAMASVWSLDGTQVAFVAVGESADTALQFSCTDGSRETLPRDLSRDPLEGSAR